MEHPNKLITRTVRRSEDQIRFSLFARDDANCGVASTECLPTSHFHQHNKCEYGRVSTWPWPFEVRYAIETELRIDHKITFVIGDYRCTTLRNAHPIWRCDFIFISPPQKSPSRPIFQIECENIDQNSIETIHTSFVTPLMFIMRTIREIKYYTDCDFRCYNISFVASKRINHRQ